jgi:cytochrome c oxidase subunit III
MSAGSAPTIAPPRRRGLPPRRRRETDSGDELPPDFGDGDDGGFGRGPGDGGDGDGGFERGSRARLGLALAIFGMSTLFAAFLIAYLLLRKNAPVWPPPGAPIPPRGLWASTLVLLASSTTFAGAVRAARAAARGIVGDGSRQRLARALGWTFALGVLFLAVQAILWRTVLLGGRFAFSDAYGTIFYSLTGLHAAHVVGGLLFLGRVSARARREPGSTRTLLSVELCSTYWHFMDAVWIVLFCVLTFLS